MYSFSYCNGISSLVHRFKYILLDLSLVVLIINFNPFNMKGIVVKAVSTVF